ncbi:MAG: hypothetical protein H2B00_00600 [Nitrosopumilaceae archaeon]|uniref:Uncharacterized protein n=2 Tax=Candidatus Nitrosomaritimum aestuariumsis TaxID=3342354 RepID=A0AC60W996_9ARCH|nr:hypothetical protein [Nitrosopumilaceae archaeon]MBA4459967.1 hypothetical protein [Nitrosopumilaceae archaeon]MBA4460998.1 hypothetical protein [Nitrosopumilaceae archaeon]MBA4463664.1 hypothetical protein [Nitrosopumilaceae archaeon]
MSEQKTKFLDGIYSEFPELKTKELLDITDKDTFATLDDHLRAEFINFDHAKRTDLYRLSIMIEEHAQRAYQPLLATFETEHLYKYVEKRYLKILKNIPKAWIIGGFINPFFAPKTPPEKAEILTCAATNIEDMWIVVTKWSDGLFGLVAEDLGGVEKGDWFRGFFTTKNDVIQKVIDQINQTMSVNIDFSKPE